VVESLLRLFDAFGWRQSTSNSVVVHAHPLRPQAPNAKPARCSARFPWKAGLPPGTSDAANWIGL